MLKEKTKVIRKAMLLLDGATVVVSFLFSYILRQKFPNIHRISIFPNRELFSGAPSSMNEYLILLILAVPTWCLILYWNGIYRKMRTRSGFEIVWTIVKSAFFVSVAFGTLIFLLNFKFVSRLFFIIFISICFLLITAEKMMIFLLMHFIRKRGHNIQRILVVGKGKRAISTIQKIKGHPEWGLRVLGAIDDEPGKGPAEISNVHFLGNLNDLASILKKEAIDEVFFVVPRSRLNFIEKAVGECEIVGIKATVAMDLFNLKLAKCRQIELDGIPFVSFETNVAKEGHLFIKRTFDLLVSGIGIAFGLPIFLIIGALIKLTSRGPILFKQARAGLNSREFVLYKFRTMYDGAELKRMEMQAQNEMDGPVFKIKHDPRITPVGRVLRKYSLDELPQLFNVIAGHMSLIGPRALPIYEIEKFEPWQRRRLSMRPGLTCLWQIGGRNKIDFTRWMELDLQYLDSWSIWLDLKIFLKTIPAVLFGTGA
jgi:exopolysaccharide biosynthesis polyprenyl glycosylphosphotransferase